MGFFNERKIKATRKDHRCECCQKPINAGSPAIYMAGLTEDDDLWAGHAHVECRAAECAWNSERGTYHDEWDMLYMIREDDEADEWLAWLADKHPIASQHLKSREAGHG